MKIIVEPKITVVGLPQFLPHPKYEIPDDGNDLTKLAAFSAKGCYDSFGKGGRSNEDNQLAILDHAHGSVLEHIHISLFLEGITRGLTLELNRHRTFNISQRSTRYTAEEDAAIVLEPYYATLWNQFHYLGWDDLNQKPMISDIFVDYMSYSNEINCLEKFLGSCATSIREYKTQVNYLMNINPLNIEGFDLRKWARGKARNLLPHALETRGVWTNNIRGWRWFIESRSDKHAEPEIRRLADYILKELLIVAPIYFNDFEKTETYDDIPVWTPKYRKV